MPKKTHYVEAQWMCISDKENTFNHVNHYKNHIAQVCTARSSFHKFRSVKTEFSCIFFLSLSFNLRRPSACSVSPRCFQTCLMGRKTLLCQLNNTAVSGLKHHPNWEAGKDHARKQRTTGPRNADTAISAAAISSNRKRKVYGKHT